MAYSVMCTKDDFVNFFKDIPLNHGSLYNNTFPYNCLYYRAVNVWSADCWNMIKAAIWGDLTLPSQIGNYWYLPGKYGLQDLNGYQLLQACSDVSSDFTSITPGEYLVTRDYDHAGVYIGNITTSAGTFNVVECTPIWANGIQFTWVDSNGTRRQKQGGNVSVYWAYHGKLPWVDYSNTPDPPSPPDPPDPPDPPSPEPEVPGKNINVILIDKNVKKLHIIRDNAGSSATETVSVASSTGQILIDFEEATP